MRTSQTVLEDNLLTVDTQRRPQPERKSRVTRDVHTVHAPLPPRLRAILRQLGVALFSLLMLAAVTYGWLHREDEILTPEHGVGYWLGIGGASLMLMLLLYPLRKRWRKMAHLCSMGGWFRVHMILGVIGPVLILFHSNFKLGSINSNVALVSMLIVAGSGVIGRYLYASIHRGLYGRKLDAQELIDEIVQRQVDITGRVMLPAPLSAQLKAYAQGAQPRRGAGHALLALLRVKCAVLKRRAIRQQLIGTVKVVCAAHNFGTRQTREAVRDFRNAADRYFAAVGRIATFALYERMFALWHVLHLPLFVLLVLTAIGHIVAVHLY